MLVAIKHSETQGKIYELGGPQIYSFKELFELMNKEYTHIHEIGYRSMPEEMYLDWLVSLKTERAKYEDTRMSK